MRGRWRGGERRQGYAGQTCTGYSGGRQEGGANGGHEYYAKTWRGRWGGAVRGREERGREGYAGQTCPATVVGGRKAEPMEAMKTTPRPGEGGGERV